MPFTAPAFLAKVATVRPAARPTGLEASISAKSAADNSAMVRFTAVLLERARQGSPYRVPARKRPRIVSIRLWHGVGTKLR
jgi:hypothetical protein